MTQQVPTYEFGPSPWPGQTALPLINNMIKAGAADNWGPTAPANPFPFMRWRDTSVSPPVLKIRDLSNLEWLTNYSDTNGGGVREVSSSTNVDFSDRSCLFDCTGVLTLSLASAASLGEGFSIRVRALTGSVTVDPDGSETIEGGSTLVVEQGSFADIYCDGLSFKAMVSSTESSVTAIPDYQRAVGFSANRYNGLYRGNMVQMADGKLMYWGTAHVGQQGQGPRAVSVLRPSPIAGLPDLPILKYIHTSNSTAVLVDNNGVGEVYTWGHTIDGWQGQGHTANVLVATKVAALDGASIKDIACTHFSQYGRYDAMFFLADDGRMFSCGYGAFGVLGNSGTATLSTPVALVKQDWDEILAVGAGSYGNVYARDQSGDVYVWGGNSEGSAGVGVTGTILSPQLVSTPSPIVQVSTTSGYNTSGAGQTSFTIILLQDGRVMTAGHGGYGALGLGNFTSVNVFTEVTSLGTDNAQVVAGGGFYGIAAVVKNDGSLYTTGHGVVGATGQVSTANINTFTLVTNGDDVADVAILSTYYSAMIVRKNDKTMWHTGQGSLGQGSRGVFTNTSILEKMDVRHEPIEEFGISGYSTEFGIVMRTTSGRLMFSGPSVEYMDGEGISNHAFAQPIQF